MSLPRGWLAVCFHQPFSRLGFNMLLFSKLLARRQDAFTTLDATIIAGGIVLFGFALCCGAEPTTKASATAAWPGFHGVGASVIDPTSVPLKWSDKDNVAWQSKLPGRGQSSPVIWNDRVYVTAIDGLMKDHCQVVALNLGDGKIAWTATQDSLQKNRSNYFQSRSAPTPLVDANGVYAFFETGVLVGLSHDGKPLWKRNITEDYGAFESTIGLASSPLQTEDSIVLLIDHEGPSYLAAFDKRTGATKWKTDRDSRTSYSSPILVPVEGGQHIVCSSAGSLDGYDPATGKHLWTLDEVGGNRSATPLVAGNGRFVIAASPGMHGENEAEARKSNGVVEITRNGDEWSAKIVWRTEEAMPQFNSPLVYRGLAYWVNRAGVVFCYDAKTGEKHYAKRINQGCWATPVGVGDRVYIFGKDGLTTVIAAKPEFELLAENQLWDPEKVGSEPFARQRAAGGGAGGHNHDDGKQPAAGGRPTGGTPTGARPEATKPDVTKPDTGKAEASKPESAKPDAAKPESAKPEAPTGSPAASGRPTEGGRPAGAPGGAAGEGEGRRRAMTPEEIAKQRAAGDNRFADPVQYGVAIVNGSLVIRTGEVVYCLREQSSTAGVTETTGSR